MHDAPDESRGKFYTREEEAWNTLTHALGIGFAALGGIILVVMGILQRNATKTVGFLVYGLCLLTLFLASTLYHVSWSPKAKRGLRIFDHSSIFLMIAGTYTPICLVALSGALRIITLVMVWGAALVGIAIKIVKGIKGTMGEKDNLSTALYILMGWMSVVLMGEIVKNIGWGLVVFLFVGGVLFTAGTYFYKSKNIRYHHAWWHVFVLVPPQFNISGYCLYRLNKIFKRKEPASSGSFLYTRSLINL